MPQPIFFSGDETRERSAALMSSHTDLHFFLRDRVSLDIARDFANHVYLVPDMAHHLYPIRYAQPAMEGNLRIQRVDTEKPETPEGVNEMPFRTTTDWVDVIGAERKWIYVLGKLERRLTLYGMGVIARKLLALWYWMPVAQRFSNKAIQLFSRHELVVTDRLHGHILSCLMDKPHVVIDNSYGKNSTYMAEWTGKSPLVKMYSGPNCSSRDLI
jgi:pyruvyl transferase EpsO